MDLDDFITEVSNTEVLTSDEALSLILQMKGSTPRKSLQFSSQERSDIWRKEFFKNIREVSRRAISDDFSAIPETLPLKVHIKFKINYCKGDKVLIKSVLLIDPNNCSLNKVHLQKEVSTISVGTVSKLENQMHMGHQLYEVIFCPPAELRINDRALIMVQTSGIRCPIHLKGEATIGKDPNKPAHSYGGGFVFISAGVPSSLSESKHQSSMIPRDICITIQNSPWNFLAGFKYKTVEKLESYTENEEEGEG